MPNTNRGERDNLYFLKCFVVVQSLSHVRLFVTPWTAARQAFLSFTICWSLLRLMSTESVMPVNHLILGRPLLLPSIFRSIRVFPNELALCFLWPKSWSISFSISPPMNIQGWLVWYPCCLRDSRVFSSTTVWRHQFFGAQPSLWSNSHIRSAFFFLHFLTSWKLG